MDDFFKHFEHAMSLGLSSRLAYMHVAKTDGGLCYHPIDCRAGSLCFSSHICTICHTPLERNHAGVHHAPPTQMQAYKTPEEAEQGLLGLVALTTLFPELRLVA